MLTNNKRSNEVSLDSLGKRQCTESGRSYTLSTRTDVPFANTLVNLTGERLEIMTRNERRVTIEPSATPLVPKSTNHALVSTMPCAIDLDADERPAPPRAEDGPSELVNTWQQVDALNVYDVPRIVAFDTPLPSIDRFSSPGVIVTKFVAEALARARSNGSLRELVRASATHTDDNENEEDWNDAELPRVPVYVVDEEHRLVRYPAHF